MTSSIREADREGAEFLIIMLNTPGGLATSMEDITAAMLNCRTPVVVYVAPYGAKAASAGMMITISADIAAMAPGTNIGAAAAVALPLPTSPMTPGGEEEKQDDVMSKKIEHDSVEVRGKAVRERITGQTQLVLFHHAISAFMCAPRVFKV